MARGRVSDDMDDDDLSGDENPRKERRMAKKAEEHGAEERHPYKLNRDLNVAGVSHKAGDELQLTHEEFDSLNELGVLEGTEPKTPEEIQEAHDEAIEAQRERIEKGPNKTEEEEKEAASAKA